MMGVKIPIENWPGAFSKLALVIKIQSLELVMLYPQKMVSPGFPI
jgi:hypothetical protein